MPIKKKENGKYSLDVKVAGRPRFRSTYDTRAAAEKAERMYIAGKASSTLRGEKPTLKRLFDALCADLEYSWSDIKSKPRQNGEMVIEYFQPDRDPTSITQNDVDQFKKHLLEDVGNKKATVDRKLSALSVMLRYGEEKGLCGNCVKVRQTKKTAAEKNKRERFLEREHEEMFLQKAAFTCGLEWRDYFELLLETGCRTRELGHLSTRDILWSRKRLSVHPTDTRSVKTGAREVPLTDRAIELLRRQIERHPESDLLFPEFTQYKLNKTVWPRMRDAMGDYSSDFVPHMLRHTCASRLIEEGHDIATVQYWMGHNSMQTTMRYIHLSPSRIDAALQKRNEGR